MSLSGAERKFAFGAYRADGCGCPAVEAGRIDPGGDFVVRPIDTVISLYDDYVIELMAIEGRDGPGVFTTDETIARESWLDAIETLKNDPLEQVAVIEGEHVARELGWLEDDA